MKNVIITALIVAIVLLSLWRLRDMSFASPGAMNRAPATSNVCPPCPSCPMPMTPPITRPMPQPVPMTPPITWPKPQPVPMGYYGPVEPPMFSPPTSYPMVPVAVTAKSSAADEAAKQAALAATMGYNEYGMPITASKTAAM